MASTWRILTTTHFECPAIRVRLDGALPPWRHLRLWVRGLTSELKVGIAQRLAYRVYTNVEAGIEEILVGEATLPTRIDLGPRGVCVAGQEF